MNRHDSVAGAVALVVVSLVWLGMLLGVSFLATPVKFLAPSLSLPVALDVGRQTFLWYGRIEVVLAVAMVAAAWPVRSRVVRGVAAAALVGVAVQRLWLLPWLDARVEIILSGGTPPASGWHNLYIAVELGKLALIAVAATVALEALVKARRTSA